MTQSHGTQDLNGSRVSDERLAEMLAGLEGVTPGPWDCFVGNANGRGLVRIETANEHPVEAGKVIATMVRGAVSERTGEHIMRCDPDTMRAILTELHSLRSEPSEPVAWQKRSSVALFEPGDHWTEWAFCDRSEADYIRDRERDYDNVWAQSRPLYASPNPGVSK